MTHPPRSLPRKRELSNASKRSRLVGEGGHHLAGSGLPGGDVLLAKLAMQKAGERIAGQLRLGTDGDDLEGTYVERIEDVRELIVRKNAAIGQGSDPLDGEIDLLGVAKVAKQPLMDQDIDEPADELDALRERSLGEVGRVGRDH